MFYISIHAPRTGSDTVREVLSEREPMISIHAPRTGSDAWRKQVSPGTPDFNPRSPHGERHHPSFVSIVADPFQSTLPARGATRKAATTTDPDLISIHAPRTGSDADAPESGEHCQLISIHAPRTGSDAFPCPASRAYSNFNPRSPHGERRRTSRRCSSSSAFQSTLPARGATRMRHATPRRAAISIHAPRTGSDSVPEHRRRTGRLFQSTLPARGATGTYVIQCTP